MILEHLRIHNLFSYCGPCDFDLTPPGDGRNVALIWGRNGYGKTSFLNSLKLLLTGVSNELREGVQTERPRFGRNEYLLGRGDEWIGVFNQRARAAGEHTFGVTLNWREKEGAVQVERTWTMEDEEAIETLRVTPSFGAPLEDKGGNLEGEARAFIQARLPEAVMPFFIYDAEKVQQIAEANREGQLRQIEQLLDLADIDLVNDYLGRNLAHWRRDSKDTSQHKINSLGFDIQALEERVAGLAAERQDLQDQIEKTDYEIKRLDVALQARRQSALQSEESKLAGKRDGVVAALEETVQRFFDDFTRDAPLLLHTRLMGIAARELEKIASHPNRRLRDELERVFSALPERLFSDPPLPVPPLNQDQDDFLRRKLTRVLDSYRPDTADLTEGLFHLPPSKADALFRMVDDYAQDDHRRSQWSRDLIQIRKLKTELAEIERKRNDVANLAPEERRLFEERLAEKERLTDELAKLNQQLGGLDGRERNLNRDLGQKRETKRQEERKAVSAGTARDKLILGQRLQSALAAYRGMLKARRREDIEKAFNDRFAELMTSHSQIRHIQVKDDFSWHYLADQEVPVGMSNISAGMKQLVAQALLWALKNVSGKEAPVVVDTPLARFDRGHQENIITRYYPHAGAQVIMLPTDAELDLEKYALLKPHIYREYRLDNQDGDRTHVLSGGYY
ncbi:MAG: AAA family ATPase [Candidatus Thiosymbion ectosymbiont of Robbea hypermnestra]|nr:AAA family ATPase [Candidatus Thiosymbion ectosymbiont of Robbea hypermnestra]